MSIQDPIHGRIDVSAQELALIETSAFQRLRSIKQLGFSDIAFPGATHTRFSHSLGAMQMATRMIDGILPALDLSPVDAQRIRQMVRLAVLFHDLGHSPLSHVGERMMPPVQSLHLEKWIGNSPRQAAHEDYTVKMLVDSELTQMIDLNFGDDGITGGLLATLVLGHGSQKRAVHEPALQAGGISILPLLHQIVSGEVDADRMDYLRRDSYYCGVPYGQFDDDWLTRNLTAVVSDEGWTLALRHRGIWAFENFLLARYHMFLSVYFHHVVVAYDDLLVRYVESAGDVWPSDIDAYVLEDDYTMTSRLRCSKNPWAQRLVARKPFVMLLESHGRDAVDEHAAWLQLLQNEGVACFASQSLGALTRYQSIEGVPLRVVEPEIGRQSRIEDYTPLYRRFDEAADISRIYCEPDVLDKARRLLKMNSDRP